MEKTYNPRSIEQHWYQHWESKGYFSADTETPSKDAYCIMIPPPNVTGTLHMGHAFQDTLMDALIRFNRMQGKATLWQAGSDHAGIATQMVVERQLAAEGKSRHDLGRDAFIDKVWDWKEESGNTITRQLRRMGSSLDWSRERFTMDEGLSRAVTEVFVQLYDEGLIYRGKRLVNWDPVLHTAVSDLEVLSEEENGHLWHMRYPLADGSGHLVVATTRPETMLGDSAVAVHPDDERYQHLVGQQIKLPLTDRLIPIIADDYVDPEFGTGCVKITPAHDFNDYEMGLRHDLPQINILTIDASINDTAPAPYVGLDRFDARKKVIADLDQLGLLEKVVDHKLMVPRGDRSGSVIEPFLTDQWYVKIAPLAAPAIEAVEDGTIRFFPDNWKNTYYEWMRNIQDWCISRQIWWGHRIPAWYDDQDNVYVGSDENDVRQKYNLENSIKLTQDSDVLDTWFSSALWPFTTLGWPEETPEFNTFYPTSVLVTGFDIIFFWVARMIMMGIKFTGKIPFHEIYIHGLVRDSHGQKMSKSKGNVLDPLDLIDGIELETLVEKRTRGMMQPHLAQQVSKQTRKDFPDGIPAFGTDALRFTFAALASTGRDIKFDLHRIEGYRNFCNKLWNAARYVLLNTEGQDCGQLNTADDIDLSLPDRWIISRLQLVEQEVTQAIGQYRFDLAAQSIYEFTWNEYCDWYLELSKPVLNNPDSSAAQLRGTRRTLVRVLETLLRLAHPIIPFITEEIWQRIKGLAGNDGDTIMTQPYPTADLALIDQEAIADIEWLTNFVLGVRKIRSSMNIAPGKPLPVLLQNASNSDKDRLDANRDFLMTLARLESIDLIGIDDAPESATALVGDMRVLIPMSGLIDKEAELARLKREIGKIEKALMGCKAKLANQSYIDKAPEQVVAKEKQKADELESSLLQLQEQHKKIMAL